MTMFERDVQPFRLADLDYADSGFTPQLSMMAQRSGFEPTDNTGPTESGQDDPYQRGLAHGRALAAAEFDPERQQLLRLIAAASALQPEPSDELAVLIGEAVEMLVGQIVGDVAIDSKLLAERAEQAAALVAECDAARTMWVHPDDLALLDGHAIALPLKSDPAAERGSIRIDCSAGWIEHGTALYLDQLRIELGLAGDAP